ncbi:MAG: tetratricopeptide repeat protein, partial [Spirochaetota bacterium]
MKKTGIIKEFLLISVFCLLSSAAFSQTSEDYNRRGVEFADRKMYGEALDMFRKAAAMQDGNSAKAFHNRGWIMELQGNIPGALENYREAVRRNPNLADSYERMGYWYYRAGKYADAVAMGERVLRIDPSNQEVKSWLSDAFKQKMERPSAPAESDFLTQKPSPTAEKPAEKNQASDNKPAAETQKAGEKEALPAVPEIPPRMFFNFDFTMRPGYDYRKDSLKYYSTEGVVVNIPYNILLLFKPIPGSDSRFSFSAGNPYLGAVMPQVINQYEKVDAVLALGPIGVGGGILLSHYSNNLFFGKSMTMTDVKLGAIFEYRDKETSISLTAYPRAIPYTYDSSRSTGNTLDSCNAELLCSYMLDESVSYYSRLSSVDVYLFDHGDIDYDADGEIDKGVCNYFGYYEVALGLSLGNKGAVMGKDINATIEVGKRIYLQRLNNAEPYGW